MSIALQTRLLGEFRLDVNGVAVTALGASRVQSLLAYLLLHRDAPQSRQQVAFLFWPDSSETQARTNLRQLLHYLRRDLPGAEAFLQVDAKMLKWCREAPLSLDVADFEAALSRAEQAADSAARVAYLAEAVSHYGGELLPGCYDDWLVPERERLRGQFLAALETLTHLCEEARDYPAALRYTERLLQSDPVRESAYRQTMRLYALSGDRAKALHVYYTCAGVLRRELGVEPSAASREVYDQLVAAETLPTLQTFHRPLIGRQVAWAHLLSAWRSVRGGVQTVCIAGEAGIGKTHLLGAFLEWAAQQGVPVARARAYAAGGLAYAPVAEWLRSEPLKTPLAELDDVWLTEVARLLPELSSTHPDLPRPEPLSESWQRGRLYGALDRVFLRVHQPFLLVLDDAQWSDRETLDWLRHLLHFEPRARFLVLLAVRPEEVAPEHPLAGLLLELRSRGTLTDIPLEPLGARETAALATQLAGHASEAELDRLYRESEGNPLFVVEMVRAGLSLEPAASDPSDPSQRALPPRLQALLQTRLRQLSPAARDLAGLAATIGRDFTFEVLASASDLAETLFVRSLDELWQCWIVREQGASAYDFSHDKLRDAAYATVSAARRRLLHRRVAEALEAVHAFGLEAVSARIANHFEHADLPGRAIPHLQRAAEAAQRVYANEDAIVSLERALALLKTLPQGTPQDEQELALRLTLGVSLVAQGSHASTAATENYVRALALCEALDQPPDPPILRALAIAYVVRSELERAQVLGETLLELAQLEQDPVLRVEANYTLGVTRFWQGHFVLARQHLGDALTHYDPEHRRVHLSLYTHDPQVICLSRLAFLLWCLGYPDQAVQKSHEALARAQELAQPFSWAYASFWTTLLYCERREVAATLVQAERTVAHSREHHLGLWRSKSTVLQGWAQAERGDTEAGIVRIQEGLADFRATGANFLRPYFLALLADIHGKTGDTEQGLTLVSEALAAVEKTGERWSEAEVRRVQGVLLQKQAPGEGAGEAAFERALELAQQQGATLFALRAATTLARRWHLQGRSAEAHRLLRPVYCRFTEGFDIPDLTAARYVLDITS